MKIYHILALFLFFCIVIDSHGQLLNDSASNQKSYNFYRAKAKNQGRAALVLFFSGLVVSAVSLNSALEHFWEETPPEAEAGIFIGLGMELGGVVLAFASNRNRSKAKRFKTTFQMENRNSLTTGSFSKVYYPSVSFKIQL